MEFFIFISLQDTTIYNTTVIYPKQTLTSASEANLAGLNSNEGNVDNPFLTKKDASTITGFIPYVGANQSIDFNTQSLYVQTIKSDATATSSLLFSAGGFNNILRIDSQGVYSYGAAGNANDSTAFGSFAMPQTTAINNSGFGRGAMFVNVIVPNNSAFGTVTLASLIGGAGSNSAFGYAALNKLINGFQNCSYGKDAGTAQTTSSDVCNFGMRAGWKNLTGDKCINIGTLAGSDNTAGIGRISIGYQAGAAGQGDYSTVIGTSSCVIAPSTGRANTIIGSQISGLSGSIANNIILADGDGNIKYRWDGTSNTLTGNSIITGSLTISANNIITDTTTGIKFGTATNQKIAFFNKTPIIQPTNGITGAAYSLIGGTPVSTNDTFGGYTLQQLAAILINLGLTA